MNKTARTGGKNRGRYALYLPKWCNRTSHQLNTLQTQKKRKLKPLAKGNL